MQAAKLFVKMGNQSEAVKCISKRRELCDWHCEEQLINGVEVGDIPLVKAFLKA